MVLTASFVLSPVTGSLATVISGYGVSHTRLGGCTSAKLDASIGASGPHDFTVRDMHRSSARRYRSRETALRSASRDDAAASIASHPASVTIAIRPSRGCDGANKPVIWVRREVKNFSPQGWTGFSDLPGRVVFSALPGKFSRH
jgi:hypothetical protein